MPAGSSEPDERRAESARRELALGADVEQPGAQPERDREPGERQRRRLVEHLAEAVRVAPRALEQQPVHRARRLAEGEDQQVADDGGDRAARRAAAARLLDARARAVARGSRPARRRRHASRRLVTRVLAPVMYGPSTSALASRAAARRRCGRRTSPRRGRRARAPRRGPPRRAGPPCPASRASRSRAWMNSIAPTSTPRVGCAASSTVKSRAHLARDDDLLLVAARERARRQRRRRRADVERRDLLARVARRCAPRRACAPRVKRCCWPRIRLSATE